MAVYITNIAGSVMYRVVRKSRCKSEKITAYF